VGSLTTNIYPIYQKNKDLDLHVILYNQDAGVRARRINDEHLVIGWYTYVSRDKDEPAFFTGSSVELQDEDNESESDDSSGLWGSPGYRLKVREQEKLWGDINPMIEIPSTHPDFVTVDEWFRNELYGELWDSGITPQTLYEHESELKNGESKDEEHLTPIADWIEDEGGDIEYIEAISDHDYDKTTLFK
jgi:hypothetical protein